MLPLTGKELLEVIPQRPPFVMIDQLFATEGNQCTTTFTITAGNVLCDNGKLNPSGLLENIAQTAAAMAGYNSKIEKKEQPMGFIGDIRSFTYTKLPPIGALIITEVIRENEVMGVTIIAGKIQLDNEEIASCKMKIFSIAGNINEKKES